MVQYYTHRLTATIHTLTVLGGPLQVVGRFKAHTYMDYY